jgi:D-alanyl-D-alanine carboxypeptidase
MNKSKLLKNKTFISIISITIILLVVFISRELSHSKNNESFKVSIEELENKISEREQELLLIQEEKERLEQELGSTIEELEENEEVLDDLDKRNKEILELITIDKELLQKYSKVSFLNEHYSPTKVSSIDKEFWINDSKLIDVSSRIKNHLEDLLEDAKDDDVDIRVASGYRSFGTQSSLKASYLIQYGSGANTFSADQGYSEHQLGTAVDFTSPEISNGLTISFETTEAFEWLEDNAWKYGFILSYPEGNQYYQYEPWHWRFVSKDLARYLKNEDIGFYDMDQRDIWEYLQDFYK